MRRRLRKVFVLLTAFSLGLSAMFSAQAARAGQITVDIYSGFNNGGDGGPFSDLVGSFAAPDIRFAMDNFWSWHPFGLSDFGAQMTGMLLVGADGSYPLALTSSDGSSLFIDGALVLDNGGLHGPGTVLTILALTAGLHPFVVNFFEDGTGASGVDLALPEGIEFSESVPEPGTLALLGLGLAGLAFSRQRKT